MGRTILVHYHLFKNAGTSLDRSLRRSLGDGFVTYERPGVIEAPEIAAHLAHHPHIRALSSHNLRLPPPVVPEARVIPVLFIRHPLDRVRSVYDFESTQDADTDGARAAHRMDLAGYVDWRLARSAHDRTIAEFQVHRLAPSGRGSETVERALDALERLPFIGLVEAFEASLRRLAGLVPDMPGLRLENVRENRTAPETMSLDERLAWLEERLGADRLTRLADANQGDLRLWQAVGRRYGVTGPGVPAAVLRSGR